MKNENYVPTDRALVSEVIKRIGDNPERSGLVDTPKRVVSAWREMYRGYDQSHKPVVTTFQNGEDEIMYSGMITDTGSYVSMCEHHMLPFFGKYTFGYIPAEKGRVLGLSKVARVVSYYSARLQIQERLTHQIVDHLWDALTENEERAPRGMALVLSGMHMCKLMRGVRQSGSMTTIDVRGVFKDSPATRAEFLALTEVQNV